MGKFSPDQIGKYYDEWTERYLDVSEEIIQAYRPSDTNTLLHYYYEQIGFEAGQKVLDAGCGTGGPSCYFASKLNLDISGITISNKQVEILNKKLSQTKLIGKLEATSGDYHKLDQYYAQNQFDHVIFLESLGHATNYQKALDSAKKVLKPGGKIYIKDFFICKSLLDKEKRKIQKVIGNINKNYFYNTLELNSVLDWFRANDFHLNRIQSPNYENDPAIRAEFEYRNNIDLFEVMKEFMPADWYEMQWVKR